MNSNMLTSIALITVLLTTLTSRTPNILTYCVFYLSFPFPCHSSVIWGKIAKAIQRDNNRVCFRQRTGRTDASGNIVRMDDSVLRSSQPNKLTSKDLRHLHATILGKSKIPIKNVSSRMGHAKVSTTLDIYSHDFQDSDELIANKLDELVKLY